eukprot:TRINITY_DN19755_c0_g1_i1.p1 TRINITY_DN19755_c0_g1~~TRINITY_DN19755_c0_g1_i1.p1  ORF type:complete len:343 (+),score=91.06 TRINITY_DN19755_c0_g1_i1:84-1112(+)
MAAKAFALLMALVCSTAAAGYGYADERMLTATGPTAAPTDAPTSAPTFTLTATPTAQPTAVPTPEPTASPVTQTSAPTSAPGATPAPTATPADSTKTPTPTPAPTAGKAVTVFTTTLGVQNFSDFNQTAYLASMAKASSVDLSQVEVVSVKYIVTAQYSFTDTVTEAEVKKTVAEQTAGVAEADVKVTLTAARRLSSSDGRRLATTADVVIAVADPAVANTASTNAADPASFATAFQAANSKTIAAPTVTKAPKMSVAVETRLVSTGTTKIAAPTPADISTEYKAETGVDVVAEVVETTPNPTVSNSTTTTKKAADDDEETSSANKYALSFFAVAAAVVMSC